MLSSHRALPPHRVPRVPVYLSWGHHCATRCIFVQTPGVVPGDVICKVEVRKHRTFKRRGNDLHMKMTITLKEALLGFSRTIPHMDGHVVTLTEDGVTKPGQVFRIFEEGMPVHNFPSQRGALFIAITVEMPVSLSAKDKALVESITGF